MRLHCLNGDIVDLAPKHCEMTVLWLRDGYNRRFQTWRALRTKYPVMTALARASDTDKPWQNTKGVTFELAMPDKLLRYIHVLPNPTDRHGCPDLRTVGAMIGSALGVANGLEVRKVGFIHVPAYPSGRRPAQTASREEKDRMSAGAMIGALGEWDASHHEKVTDVYLFDLDGCFKPFLWGAGEPPRKPRPPLPK